MVMEMILAVVLAFIGGVVFGYGVFPFIHNTEEDWWDDDEY